MEYPDGNLTYLELFKYSVVLPYAYVMVLGTNWLFEVISMVLDQSAQRVRAQKVFTMIDLMPQSEVDKQPSPRVLNSHFPPK